MDDQASCLALRGLAVAVMFSFAPPAYGVNPSADLNRIMGLPYREAPDGLDTAVELSEALRTEFGKQTLHPIQAAALTELYNLNGVFCPIRVGGGKTLLSFLAPIVVEAKRPMLLVPANLREKTEREFIEIAAHWVGHPHIRIETYERLSVARHANMLDEYQPDLLILDECHKLKDPKTARTRRMTRFIREYEPKVMAMTGTPQKRSMKDYNHLVRWCLGDNMAPVPSRYHTLSEWAAALDTGVKPHDRRPLGVLKEAFGDTLEKAQEGYGRRFRGSYGVVGTQETSLDLPLHIRGVTPALPDTFKEYYKTLRERFITPTGIMFSDRIALWRHARELACGFVYRWEEPGPPGWMDARSEFHSFVRQTIAHSRKLDSMFEVVRHHADKSAVRDWVNIRDTFTPVTVADWHSDAVVNYAADWAAEHPRGIIWAEQGEFGRRLSKVSGLPYFAQQGRDANNVFIEDYEGPMIASIHSNREGRNLQYNWSDNLIINCVPAMWEQVLGRTHRPYQTATEVNVDVSMVCSEQLQGFEQAMDDARGAERKLLQAQKLVHANLTMPTEGMLM